MASSGKISLSGAIKSKTLASKQVPKKQILFIKTMCIEYKTTFKSNEIM